MPNRLLRTGESESDRVEAFSDGVLAIVITLLVLDIKVPDVPLVSEAAIWHSVAAQAPKIAAWVVSFAFVLVFWVAHHYFFRQLRKVDRGLLWLNGLFLLTISFTPYPTALSGQYPLSRPATFLLSAAMFLTASCFSLMRWYATMHASLVDDRHMVSSQRAFRRGLLSPLLYSIGMASSFVYPPIALAIQVIVPLIFFLPPPGHHTDTAHHGEPDHPDTGHHPYNVAETRKTEDGQ